MCVDETLSMPEESLAPSKLDASTSETSGPATVKPQASIIVINVRLVIFRPNSFFMLLKIISNFSI